MIEINYVSSTGKVKSLIGDKMRATSGSFHKYSWVPNQKERDFGDILYGFKRKAATYEIILTFRGDIEERRVQMDELTALFESDVINKTPGKIWYGDYYIPCYVTESESGVSETWNNWSTKKINIYCPYPFWCRDKTCHFYTNPDAIMEEAPREEISEIVESVSTEPEYPRDYPYEYALRYKPPIKRKNLRDYPYDYYKNHTVGRLDNDHFAESDFKMIVYGPCTHLEIRIGSNLYRVSAILYDNEYLVIDSRERTIVKYGINGVQTNLFNARDKEHYIFQKIPAGKQTVRWNAQYSFDVILYQERSEPLWSIS